MKSVKSKSEVMSEEEVRFSEKGEEEALEVGDGLPSDTLTNVFSILF